MEQTQPNIRVLCLGDVVASSGIAALRRGLKDLRQTVNADFVIINGENATGGLGIDSNTLKEVWKYGADVVTLGDHAWAKKDLKDFLSKEESTRCLRPANFPGDGPGRGFGIYTLDNNLKICVINLLGRVFLNISLDCPFKKAEEILGQLPTNSIIIIDVHAEATSEKCAMGRFLDGRVSLVFGTHSHIQTADETILPGGTAYITDLGMCGSSLGIIGMDTESALSRFLGGTPKSYKPAHGAPFISGVVVEINKESRRAVLIERVKIPVNI